MPQSYDLIIVGAGLVGGALACALGEQVSNTRINIALVDAQPLHTDPPVYDGSINDFDPRVSALTIASQELLKKIAVWDLMVEGRISPYNNMHVWDAEGTGEIHFDAKDINQSALGYIVENKNTLLALAKRIQQQKNIQVIAPAKVVALKDEEKLKTLVLEDGTELMAPLIVAADGANSPVRTMANFETREWNYNHQAIVCTVEIENSHQQTAWQRFLPEGPLAFLPLSMSEKNEDKNFCSIVWSAVPSYAENLMALSEADFNHALGRAFENKLGDVKATSKRFSFPLRQRHAVDYVKSGLVLIGDAAHSIHPLAGQGVNLGLLDVQVLAEEILRAEQRQLNLGDLHVLQRYQRRRKGDNLAMMAAMDGFKKLFEEPALPIRWLRNTGMSFLDRQSTLKHSIMRKAMGL